MQDGYGSALFEPMRVITLVFIAVHSWFNISWRAPLYYEAHRVKLQNSGGEYLGLSNDPIRSKHGLLREGN
jgi:hypothetical protein